MKSLPKKDMIRLFRFARVATLVVGVSILGYGSWLLIIDRLTNPGSLSSWLGIFPIYIGAMILILAFAMREEWFTDARRYW